MATLFWLSSLSKKELKSLTADMKLMNSEIVDLEKKLNTCHLSKINSTTVAAPIYGYLNLLEEDRYFSRILPVLLPENFKPCGTLKQAVIYRPENLNPLNGLFNVSKFYKMCVGSIATHSFGKSDVLSPDLALCIESRPRADFPDRSEYWVHLRRDIFWQPLNPAHFSYDIAEQFCTKHPVTAHDFKLFFDTARNFHSLEKKAIVLRSDLQNIESFVIVDDHTFIVRWKEDYISENVKKVKYSALELTASLQPLPSFVYLYFANGEKIINDDTDPYTYQNSAVWAHNFSHHWANKIIVSCGPYIFDGIDSEGIYFKRNSEYHQPLQALLEKMHFYFEDSLESAWQDFKNGKIDICNLSTNHIDAMTSFLTSEEYAKQAAQGQAIRFLDYVDPSFYYIGWNLTHQIFKTAKIRQALSFAIDRHHIIENNLTNMAINITGPLFYNSIYYDKTIIPYAFNPIKAGSILDEEGWNKIDNEGFRYRIINEKPERLGFKLSYLARSSSAKNIVEYITEALHEIGIECKSCGLDIDELYSRFDSKNFDAIFMGWQVDQSPEILKSQWHSENAKKIGSNNAVGFENLEVDKILSSLMYESDKEKRIKLYHRLHNTIHEDAPYTFLYTPKARLVFRENVYNIFIPRDNQNIISDASCSEPNTEIVWIKHD